MLLTSDTETGALEKQGRGGVGGSQSSKQSQSKGAREERSAGRGAP